MAAQTLSKNQLRRAKKKAEKQQKSQSVPEPAKDAPSPEPDTEAPATPTQDEATTVASEPMIIDESNPLFGMYKDVLGRFEEENAEATVEKEQNRPEVFLDDANDDIPDEEQEIEDAAKLSKKKRKLENKLTVAELKAVVQRPEMVEWTDTSAQDPKLLVHIKSQRNVVPVPSHWSLKREYLSSKRGVEKPPFSLPKFIQETGIAEMRDAVLEKQNEASLKQRQRERVQPKMGKLDIDYQKLWEAFFRRQTKPELTRFGEVYYEGKEYETNLRHLRPGELSDELKEALGIPPGAPPPWLINQQRFGPPPSYPALKIPGLNAPLPAGASWGFQAGGYGKPPVDDSTNRPLYGGDIFGVMATGLNTQQGEPVERELWGEIEPDEEQEEEEEEEEDDEEQEEAEAEDDETPAAGRRNAAGIQTPAGIQSSMPHEISRTESVTEFDLRKRRGNQPEESGPPRAAYTVIPEHQTQVQGFFGGDRGYDMSAAQRNVPMLGQEDSRKRKKPGDVEVSMDPDALAARDGLDKDDVRKAYEQQKKTEQSASTWNFDDDLSDMIATEQRKRQKRDEERRSRR